MYSGTNLRVGVGKRVTGTSKSVALEAAGTLADYLTSEPKPSAPDIAEVIAPLQSVRKLFEAPKTREQPNTKLLNQLALRGEGHLRSRVWISLANFLVEQGYDENTSPEDLNGFEGDELLRELSDALGIDMSERADKDPSELTLGQLVDSIVIAIENLSDFKARVKQLC